MIKVNCDNCGKEIERKYSYQVKGRNYCNASCQIKDEYKKGIRNKNTIAIKAQKVSHEKQKEHNWLNDKKSRDKLKKIQQTDEYKIKTSLCKVGEKNPMFGKKGKEAGHYKGGSYRDKNGSAFRGPLWKKIKFQIKQRDNNKCRHCGCNENLQIHHIVPYKCTQDNDEDNLITLCSKCHGKCENKFHKIKSIKKEYYKGNVYNFSVKDDETYVAENMFVHNCRSRIIYIQPKVEK
jgi:endogenous inhibitor of DNA gyrase (YacG/DUF329 family)